MSESPRLPNLADGRAAVAAADALVSQALVRATEITAKGERIDDHQVLAERVAYAATEGRAARELVESVAEARQEGRGDGLFEALAAASAA
jgi:alkylation response protein AidB-like acyl-CoA dehydrogenase